MPPNPKSVKVNVTTGAGMDIDWDDGHHTHYTFQWLRDACPCATCTEERNNHSRKPGEPPKAANTLLPMYKEPVKPKEVKLVGRYAMNIAWNDGHASGIYSWDYLREMCQCEECRAKVAAS
jgi:prepilin-type processing-associated H-X9-DG protein